MARAPQPLFETYDNFIEQDFSMHGSPLACVASFLNECDAALEPDRGYAAVRAFLRAFSDNAQTFNSYRSHVERLLLWALLVQGKPLNHLKRQDAQDYLDFCRNPPADWVGATACLIDGSVVQPVARVTGGAQQRLAVEHPCGEFTVEVGLENGQLGGCGLVRTARLLFDGYVCIAHSIWTGPA